MNKSQTYLDHFPLFHLSEKCHDNEMFIPKQMDKERVMEGENWRSKRICASKSIDGAVSAIVDSISMFSGLELFVHVPENLDDLFNRKKIYKPTLKQVPDSEATDEFWIKAPCKMKCIGKIMITGIDPNGEKHFEVDGDDMTIDRFFWRWMDER